MGSEGIETEGKREREREIFGLPPSCCFCFPFKFGVAHLSIEPLPARWDTFLELYAAWSELGMDGWYYIFAPAIISCAKNRVWPDGIRFPAQLSLSHTGEGPKHCEGRCETGEYQMVAWCASPLEDRPRMFKTCQNQLLLLSRMTDDGRLSMASFGQMNWPTSSTTQENVVLAC